MATDTLMNTLLEIELDNDNLNSFSFDGCEWRKPYTCTIPSKPTGVAAITVTRSNSESNCDQLSATSLTSTGKVLYGDTISVSASPATGYSISTNPSFKSGVSGGKVVGDVTLNAGAATGNTYYVYYKQGLASSTTNLPSTQSRTYPNATTLASNTMSKSATTSSGYSLSYAAGLSTSGTLPSTTTATDTTSYTANGWTTGSTSLNDPDYANGASFGSSNTSNLTLYPNFTSSLSRGSVTVGTNNMAKSNTTANSYTVTYANGTATSGTLPSKQTSINTTTYTKNGWTTSSTGTNDRDYTNGQTISNFSSNLTLYPNFTTSTTNGGVTLGTNNMAKSNTTADSYTVSYAQGNASSTTNLPAKQTSINTTVYTKNGWTTTSGSTTRSYANGVATGALSGNLTLYPCFSQTTTNGGVTVSSNTMSKSNTTSSGYKVTYAQGTASSTTNLPSAQTATDTTSYTHNGWATSASGSKVYSKGGATGALSSNITLYPYFDSSLTRGSVTLSTNSMTKSNTTDATYTVTFNYNGNGTANTTATATKIRTYTANGWTTTSGSETRTHTNSQSVQVTSNLTLYPCFTQSTSTSAVTLPTPTRTGYTFKGWSTSSSATSGTTGTYTPSENVTLYAIWSANTYYVYYNKGLSTGGTLPSTQSRTYPNAVTLATNSMTKTATTANSYTVAYAQGNASSTTNLPSTQTSINTTSYSANGWTTGSSNTNDPDHASGASFGSNDTTNLTLYPNFTTSTTNGGVTTSNNTMSRSNGTASGYTVTYNKGTATSNPPAAQTATDTISYTHAGWATSANGSKAYNKNTATGALSSNITLYPYFTSAVATRGSVTLATNNMTKSSTTDATYTVTYNYNYSGSSNTTATATKTRTYTANGWTTTSGSQTRTHTNGQSVQMTSALVLYPCFTQSTSTSSVTLPTPTRSGYTFKGWATSSTATSGTAGGNSYTPTANVTLYAIWHATVSFTNPSYGTWGSTSLSLPVGTTYSVSGRTITFTRPDKTTVTNTVTATSPTARTLSFTEDSPDYGKWDSTSSVSVYDYSYSTPTIGVTTGTISAATTISASNTRSNVTFTNSLSTTPTNSSTSGSHVWTISGTNTSGTAFTRKFTTTAHGAQYYYVISRSSTATQATGNIAFKPTVARNTHTYTVSFTNPSYGTWGSASLSLPYGTTYSISNNKVTFTKPDGSKEENTATATSPTARELSFGTASYGSWDSTQSLLVYDYSYTTPSVAASGSVSNNTINGAATFTGTNSRNNVTFTNALGGTPGTNSTTSGHHLWKIIGKTTAGVQFERTFTTTAHSAQYYYTISRSSTATQATSNIKFTPTVTRSTHTYTITYNKGTATSGTLPSTQTVAYGSTATLGSNSMAKSNTTISSYTVTYNANGGSVSPTSATATKLKTYTVNGWTTTSGSTTRTYTNGQQITVTGNITLYPCFSEGTSGGSVTLPTPTRSNYTFKGWATSSSATSGITGSYTPTSNVTLYATWESTVGWKPIISNKTIGAGTTTASNMKANTKTEATFSGSFSIESQWGDTYTYTINPRSSEISNNGTYSGTGYPGTEIEEFGFTLTMNNGSITFSPYAWDVCGEEATITSASLTITSIRQYY